MLSVRLDSELLDALDRLAKKKGVSRSQLIRQALMSFCKRELIIKVKKLPKLHLGGKHPQDEELYPEL